MNTSKKCTATNPEGGPCGAWAMAQSDFCYLHNPDTAEERHQAQVRGGGSKNLTVKNPLPLMELKKPDDVVTLLAETINEVRAGNLDIRVANCLGALSGQLIRALEVSQLAGRVEFIEQVIIERRG